jgi:hypothetical protein
MVASLCQLAANWNYTQMRNNTTICLGAYITKVLIHEVDITCSCRMPYSFNSCRWRCNMILRKLTASLKFEVFLQTLYIIFCFTWKQGELFHQLNITKQKRSKAQDSKHYIKYSVSHEHRENSFINWTSVNKKEAKFKIKVHLHQH